MPISFNSPSKQVIRNNWSAPLLEFICSKLKKKLFYLGLPSSEAEDIKTWIDYLYRVYAFQCRQYPFPSDDTQPRDEILKLEDNLLVLERTKKLETFEVFDGYIEEVLINGKDNSPNTKVFSQDEIVTLYNLDFCNQITEPQKIFNENGEEVSAYKMDALNKLIEFQSKVVKNSSKFILFLTIHSSYSGDSLNDFVQNPPINFLVNYFQKLNNLSKTEKRKRILRAFVYDNINSIFSHYGFNSEFLPVINYTGNGNHKLLHFTVIGTKMSLTAGRATAFQKIESFVSEKFIDIENNTFQNIVSDMEEKDVNVNSLNVFKNSKTFKKLWV